MQCCSMTDHEKTRRKNSRNSGISAVCREWPTGIDEAGKKGAEMKKILKRSRCLHERHRLHKKLYKFTVA